MANKKPMKYWAVSFVVDATGHGVVAAETEEKAREIALEGYFVEMENVDLGDAQEATDVVEIDLDDYLEQRNKGRDCGSQHDACDQIAHKQGSGWKCPHGIVYTHHQARNLKP